MNKNLKHLKEQEINYKKQNKFRNHKKKMFINLYLGKEDL